MTAASLLKSACHFFTLQWLERSCKDPITGSGRRLIDCTFFRLVGRHSATKYAFHFALDGNRNVNGRSYGVSSARHALVLGMGPTTDSLLDKRSLEFSRRMANTDLCAPMPVAGKPAGCCRPARRQWKENNCYCAIDDNACLFQPAIESTCFQVVRLFLRCRNASLSDRRSPMTRHAFFSNALRKILTSATKLRIQVVVCMVNGPGCVGLDRTQRPKADRNALPMMRSIYLQELGGAMHNLEIVYAKSGIQGRRMENALSGGATEIEIGNSWQQCSNQRFSGPRDTSMEISRNQHRHVW